MKHSRKGYKGLFIDTRTKQKEWTSSGGSYQGDNDSNKNNVDNYNSNKNSINNKQEQRQLNSNKNNNKTRITTPVLKQNSSMQKKKK